MTYCMIPHIALHFLAQFHSRHQAMEDTPELRRCTEEIAALMLQRGVSYARPWCHGNPREKGGKTMGKLGGISVRWFFFGVFFWE